MIASALQAQVAVAQGGFLEEVIVTAEKRETTLQDTAIAVSAFSQDELERGLINNNMDIQMAVPNMLMSKGFFTTAQISIRGIGNLAVGATADTGTSSSWTASMCIATTDHPDFNASRRRPRASWKSCYHAPGSAD